MVVVGIKSKQWLEILLSSKITTKNKVCQLFNKLIEKNDSESQKKTSDPYIELCESCTGKITLDTTLKNFNLKEMEEWW